MRIRKPKSSRSHVKSSTDPTLSSTKCRCHQQSINRHRGCGRLVNLLMEELIDNENFQDKTAKAEYVDLVVVSGLQQQHREEARKRINRLVIQLLNSTRLATKVFIKRFIF